MIRNLKALGLALVAVFAMSAMVASAAQAEPTITGYNTEKEKDVTTTVTGSQTVPNGLKFHEIKKTQPPNPPELGGAVQCEEANFHGHLETGSSKELTLTPTFGGPNTQTGCTASGLPATVTTEGCTFRFHNATKIEETMTYSLQADLVCPAGKSIIVHGYADKEHKIPVCTLIVEPIAANQNLTGIEAHVNTTKPTDLTVTVHTVVQYRTEGTCGKANKEATYTGEVTLKGYEATKVGSEIKETGQIDLDING